MLIVMGVGLVFIVGLIVRQNGRILLRLSSIEQELVTLRVAGSSPMPVPPRVVEADAAASLTKSKINRDGLERGVKAPDFSVTTLDGTAFGIKDMRGQKKVLLFVSTNCQPCDRLLEGLRNLSPDSLGGCLVVVAKGQPSDVADKLRGMPAGTIIGIQSAWEVSRAYATFQLPSAYIVDGEGRIASELAVGPDAGMALIHTVMNGDGTSVSTATVNVVN